MLLVCAATRPEYDACLAGIRDAGLTTSFDLLRVGVGPAHAARSLRERLARGPAPSRILSCGFAGALVGGVPLGAWITAETLSEWKDGALVPVVRPVAVASCLPCDVVSADHLVGRDSPLRSVPRDSSRPLVADMESAALSMAAGAIALSVVRLVSDTPEHPLPEFLAPFTAAMAGTDSPARSALRGVGSALTDPRGVARLLREGRTWTKKLREGFATLAPSLVSFESNRQDAKDAKMD
ncbi:hypothetical protein LZC95_17375 [Pendulispora brunnea]|uniref:Nucleoside phosphorylase domain-containing protein n=1 Tax=Pendulispora brunnea TaxID=2905690 RepID=A0ABZ2KLV5_9BACT